MVGVLVLRQLHTPTRHTGLWWVGPGKHPPHPLPLATPPAPSRAALDRITYIVFSFSFHSISMCNRTMLVAYAALLALVAAVATSALRARNEEYKRQWARAAYMHAKSELPPGKVSKNKLLRLAVAFYRKSFRRYPSSDEALRQFIWRWGRDKRAHLVDLPRWAQRSMMTDAECEQCIQEIRAGYSMGDVKFGFVTLDDAATRKHPDLTYICPTVHKCRRRYNTSHGMMDRLKAFDPKFTHITVRHVDPLTPKLKARRVRECRTLLSQGLERRKRTFYIDAKTLLVSPKSHQVIGYKEDMEKYGMLPVGGAKWRGVVTKQRALIKIQIYCMVNWHGGVCGMWVCQGSTGVADVYEVGVLWE